MNRELTQQQKIERSIIKKYRKDLWNKFVMGVKDFQLIEQSSQPTHIVCGVSGGKNSLAAAKCLQHLQKYSNVKFDLDFIFIDPGFEEADLTAAENILAAAGVKVKMFHEPIISAALKQDNTLEKCRAMIFNSLLEKTAAIGGNVLSLGTNFDDVIEYIFSSMVFEGKVQTIPPKEVISNVEIIRPIYMVKQSFIDDWARYNNLDIANAPLMNTAVGKLPESIYLHQRKQYVKSLISRFRHTNSNIENNIFKSVYNVNLRTVIGWEKDGKRVNFLETYSPDFESHSL